MPLISFIIPSYNVPRAMLRECIDSILATGLSDDEREIIVVDDGSDVPCTEVLKDCSDRLTVIRQENQGLSVARNTGIDHARGEYLQFVDADDMLICEPYNLILKTIRDERPDALVFRFTASRPSGTLNAACSSDFLTAFSSGADYMLACNLQIAACCYLFRRSSLGGLRFVPNLKNEDERFTTLLFIGVGRTLLTETRAYYYRQREGSLQHIHDAAFINKRLDDFASTLFLLNGTTCHDDTQRKAMRRRVSQMTMDYIYNTIVLTRCWARLGETIAQLKVHGLFPMPHVRYTTKYFIFSHLANHAIGRWLLLRLLPLLPKEA